jgi:subtilase family serine protease
MITAKNLVEYAPSPNTVVAASEIFQANGFKVGPMVGVSFSITGTIKTFQKFFGTQVQIGKDGTNEFVVNGEVIGNELSGMELPKELHGLVAIVAFP